MKIYKDKSQIIVKFQSTEIRYFQRPIDLDKFGYNAYKEDVLDKHFRSNPFVKLQKQEKGR